MRSGFFSVACGLATMVLACAPATGSSPPEDAGLIPAQASASGVGTVAKRSALPEIFTYTGELTQGGWLRGKAPAGTTEAFLGSQRLSLDKDGNFFAAFDRDAAGEATLRAALPGGRAVTQALVVAPRKWNVEHVNVARRPSGMTDAFWKIREPELAQIEAARKRDAETAGWSQRFIWPVRGRISGRFGSQRIYRGEAGSYHSGLDIAPGAGVTFVAPADGVVTLAAKTPFSLEGHLIIVDHGQGLNSAFLHCASIAVEEGQVVKQGQELGTVGMSGRATGPHLHWSLKWHDARLDPLLFLGPMA